MIRNGSQVTMHYVLKVDGREIESSRGAGPVEYVHGQQQILPGLENELEGLEEGQRKRVAVEPDEAYGQPDPEGIRSFPRSAFHDLPSVRVGEMVQGKIGTKEFHATIMGVDDEQVLLDMNHPLAGKTLEYDVEIVKVE
ncbi:MAG TPA: FKBP-type peptidyl-prolyl cis-trans isomerase [Vicinamibacteria bacterium]|nr:FKBP-type peptidyl-prolyl cis-trans isomerase [Vicinamibacteria bacterium]